MVGRIRYDRVVTRPGDGLREIHASNGAPATASAVVAPSASTASVTSRWVYASPPPGSRLRARTSTGTRTLVRMPPSSSS